MAEGVTVASRSAASVRFCSGGMEGTDKSINGLNCEELGWGNQADKWTAEGQQPGSAAAAEDCFSAPRRVLVPAGGLSSSESWDHSFPPCLLGGMT